MRKKTQRRVEPSGKLLENQLKGVEVYHLISHPLDHEHLSTLLRGAASEVVQGVIGR